jgi:hypothetical protein
MQAIHRAMDASGASDRLVQSLQGVPLAQQQAHSESLATLGTFFVPDQTILDYVAAVNRVLAAMPMPDCARAARGHADGRSMLYLNVLDSTQLAAWATARINMIKAGLDATSVPGALADSEVDWLGVKFRQVLPAPTVDRLWSIAKEGEAGSDEDACWYMRTQLEAMLAMKPTDRVRAYRIFTAARLQRGSQ